MARVLRPLIAFITFFYLVLSSSSALDFLRNSQHQRRRNLGNHHDRRSSAGRTNNLIDIANDKRKQNQPGRNSVIEKNFKKFIWWEKTFQSNEDEDPTKAPVEVLPQPPKPHPKPPIPVPVVKDERVILPSSGVAYERFGKVVSASDGVIAVATHYVQGDEANGQDNFVYIFCQQETSPQEEALLTMSMSHHVSHLRSTNFTSTDAYSSTTTAWKEVSKISTNQLYPFWYDNVMAMDRNFLFVGGSGFLNDESTSGKVYVFSYDEAAAAEEKEEASTSSKCQRVADGYTFENAQVLSSPVSTASSANFGSAIAVSGDVAAINSFGAAGEDGGAVYMYHYDSEQKSWQYSATLTSNNWELTEEGYSFGEAIALTESIVAVASVEIDGDQEGVCIFDIRKEQVQEQEQEKEGAGTYSYSYSYSFVFSSFIGASSVSSGSEEISAFGRTLAFTDDTGFVSALTEDGSGTVFVFRAETNEETGVTSWTQVSQLMNPFDTSFSLFGESLSLTSYKGDSFAIVASPGDEISGHLSGSLFLYGKSNDLEEVDFGKWTSLGRVTNENTASYDHYGQSVAVDGSLVIVGADLANGITTRSGAVYVEDELMEYMSELLNQEQGGAPSPQQPSPGYSNQKRTNSWSVLTSHKPFVIALVVAAALPAIVIAAILGKRVVGSINRITSTHVQHKSSFSLVLDESTRGDMDPDEVLWNNNSRSDHSDEDGFETAGRGVSTKNPQHQRLSHLEIDI